MLRRSLQRYLRLQPRWKSGLVGATNNHEITILDDDGVAHLYVREYSGELSSIRPGDLVTFLPAAAHTKNDPPPSAVVDNGGGDVSRPRRVAQIDIPTLEDICADVIESHRDRRWDVLGDDVTDNVDEVILGAMSRRGQPLAVVERALQGFRPSEIPFTIRELEALKPPKPMEKS